MRTWPALLLLWLLMVLPAFAAPHFRAQVILYEDEYFGGLPYPLGQGQVAEFPDEINRKVSSIWIHPTCKATVFSEPHFRGRSVTWTVDSDHLDRLRKNRENYRRSWENKIRSIRIDCGSNHFRIRRRSRRSRPIPEFVTILYKDEYFQGDSYELRPGRYAVLPRWIDRDARSIWIHPLCKATVYSDTHFRGRRVTWSANSDNLGRLRKNRENYQKSWNAKIRSLMVECDYSREEKGSRGSSPRQR